MKKKFVGFIYVTIWNSLLLGGTSLTFPILFKNPYINTLSLRYWSDLFLFFDMGGVIPWTLVLAFAILFFLMFMGTVCLFVYGYHIIPSYKKYARKHKKAKPFKKRLKEYKNGRRFA